MMYANIGMDRADFDALRERVAERGLPDPYRAFSRQANGARLRDIPWQLTFAQWWSLWEPYYHLRGTGKNGLCMAREGDEGPYALGNIYLTTNMGNMQDYHRRCSRAIEARKEMKEKKEMAFARAGSTSAANSGEKLSHHVWKARNTSKSTCNHKDDDISYEMSAP